MIRAKKSRTFEYLFSIYNRGLIRRRFSAVWVQGLEELSKAAPPSIICVNHSSWWDGLIALEVGRRAGLNNFFMMEERQLKNLRPFTRLGAFSVVREDARQALESIEFATEVLRSKDNPSVWIFPQGEIRPNFERPLNFFSGIEHLAKRVIPCRAVPVGMRFEFLGGVKPEVFISIGSGVTISNSDGVANLANSMEDSVGSLLQKVESDIASGRRDHYQNLIG